MKKTKCMAKGGSAKHEDAKQDKKMIVAAVKKVTGKEPMKLAAGGAAKCRKDFPMTKGKK